MRCRIQQRSLPLHPPFRTSGWTLTQRDIILFSIHDKQRSLNGWGEAAPLPAFGTEDMTASLHALEAAAADIERAGDAIVNLLASGPVPASTHSAANSIASLQTFIPELAATPAARFAVECALLDLHAQQNGISLAEALGGRHRDRIPVNAVIGAVHPEEAAAAAAAAHAQGFGCLKIKVGGGTLEEDVDRIRAVRLAVPAETLIRLDANGAWEFGEAERALREFAMYDIEYIEQPVPAEEADELAALTGLGIIRIAADESAQNLAQARALLARNAVDLFVVKPMAAGSLRECRTFAFEAAARGCDVVFTSLIDSSIGRRAVAQLCASLPASTRHHGLATGALFLDDTGRDDIAAGSFILPEAAGLGIAPTAASGAEDT